MVPSRLAEFKPLRPAEERVIADLRSGVLDRLGDGMRPIDDDPARTVRAELLRFLILGGDDDSRPHEKGLRIAGACIEGVLDLEGCRIPRDIGLKDCLFNRAPTLRSAVIDNLFLDGSALPGLQADRLEARGGLYHRGAAVSGEIELRGARLGGHFDCSDHVHSAAALVEHYIGPELQDELATALKEPPIDPHGKQIPPL